MAEQASTAYPAVRGLGPRVAVVSMHTSPTAALGHSANGGLNVYVRELSRALGSAGIASDVFTRCESAERHVDRFGPLSRAVFLPAGRAGLDKYELAAHTEEFAVAVDGWAARQGLRYDVLHSHYWLSGLVARTLSRRWGVGWVHTFHTLAAVKNGALAPGDRPEPRGREEAEAGIAREADLLVVSTEEEAQAVSALYGTERSRVVVVPPGVDSRQFRPLAKAAARAASGIDAGRRVLLFAGRLERLKGAEVAIRAFAAVAEEFGDVDLVVAGGDTRAGDESETDRLRALVEELGVKGRVEFRGSVPHAGLRQLYAAAEALVMPSYNESFGLVGLEAQASGTAVVAADVSGLRSVVRDGVTGHLVPGHDPRDYAERLRALLADPLLAEQMGRRATLLAQRFSWERTRDRFLAAIEPVLERAGQARVHAGATHE